MLLALVTRRHKQVGGSSISTSLTGNRSWWSTSLDTRHLIGWRAHKVLVLILQWVVMVVREKGFWVRLMDERRPTSYGTLSDELGWTKSFCAVCWGHRTPGSLLKSPHPPDGSTLAADHLWVSGAVTATRWPPYPLHLPTVSCYTPREIDRWWIFCYHYHHCVGSCLVSHQYLCRFLRLDEFRNMCLACVKVRLATASFASLVRLRASRDTTLQRTIFRAVSKQF